MKFDILSIIQTLQQYGPAFLAALRQLIEAFSAKAPSPVNMPASDGPLAKACRQHLVGFGFFDVVAILTALKTYGPPLWDAIQALIAAFKANHPPRVLGPCSDDLCAAVEDFLAA